MISEVVSSRSTLRVPGPQGYPVVGALPKVMKDPLQFLSRMVREYGDVVHLGGFGAQQFYFVSHPRDIEHVWKTHSRNYVRGSNFRMLKPLGGNGLFLNEGEPWKTQRRLLQPAFHVPRLMGMVNTINASTAAMLERWRRGIVPGDPFDLEHEMMDLLIEVSVKTLFGTEVAGDGATVHEAITTAFSILHRKVLVPVPSPWWVPFPANVRFLRAVARLDEVVYRIIEERRKSGVEGDDVLSTLLSVRDEDGNPMPDQQIRDEVVTMLVAGHESTGTSLSWTLYLLSRYPSVVRQVEEELADVLGGRTPEFQDLPKLKYLSMVLKEGLRLYPPFWMLTRTPLEDDEISGHRIPAGSILMFSSYVTHRRPDFWPNPEAFDPERFLPEESEGRPPFAYFPLGGGPRVCIGGRLAEMQSLLVLASVLQRYSLHAVPGKRVEPAAMLSLRPKGGLWMTLHERPLPS
ncbi:MAG TPA: cytochrome P450 [Thermoanaerobaculia bacterium]|jgi:cytochrome P450|nr:cytochrome P450 [Thermoanaerobaculia bacterium]